ncbi:MAG TPA: ATP-dependent sacrificial sulfur transferase LarE [Gemmatimonadaceae bacterium]|nr:ATP-dependent sacrificial sulfur transferase LarE [Gemmatimonadaceae bacterium]
MSASIPGTSLEKERALSAWLRARAPVLIGYSGGVDSVYLAAVAAESLDSDELVAVIGRSASYPEEQWRVARDSADRLGVRVLEASTDEMNDPRYAANPSNRCYFCKTELWQRLRAVAAEHGIATIVDGTNADDLRDWRPGAQAAREHHVRSPLAELGFTKAEIRERSRARALPTWSQPSSPCLSSRIPYGTAVTVERLRQVERAERALRDLGVTGDLRVRHHGTLARVEISAALIGEWLRPERSALIVGAVRAAGFTRVALDLRGFRSGSLNVLHGVTAA